MNSRNDRRPGSIIMCELTFMSLFLIRKAVPWEFDVPWLNIIRSPQALVHICSVSLVLCVSWSRTISSFLFDIHFRTSLHLFGSPKPLALKVAQLISG